jgi:uroporphyrinogen-III decarboxylase
MERYGVGVLTAVAVVVLVLTGATVWLFVTSPVTLATAMTEGDVSPFIRDLADVLLQALKGLLKYL